MSEREIEAGDVILLVYCQHVGRVTEIYRDESGRAIRYRIRWLYHVYPPGEGFSSERAEDVVYLRGYKEG